VIFYISARSVVTELFACRMKNMRGNDVFIVVIDVVFLWDDFFLL
jgi:hypothetical protein